jgi:uncharacterized membrane protein
VKNFFKSIQSVFLTGLLIVFPAWLATLLFLKVLMHLKGLMKPITVAMPDGVNHPLPWSILAFVLACLAVGLLFHTAIGKLVGRAIEQSMLQKIPGYQPLRNISRQFQDMDASDGFKPALIEVEDGCLAPAFLIDIHADGNSTVFMPSVPTPMAGSIFIMPSARVHPIDVPVTTMMKCISKWGTGSGELLAKLHANPKNPASLS